MTHGLSLVLLFPFKFGGKADGELCSKYKEVPKMD